MEITFGMVLVLASAAGVIGCVIGLIVTRPVFKRQRRNLLDEIESE